MNVKDLKKIDVHAHAAYFHDYYPPSRADRPYAVFIGAEQLLEMYDRLGVEKGILLPISSPEGQISPMTSESCKALADRYPDRFYWFCNVDPRAYNDNASCDLTYILRHYQSLGAKGVGEITAHIDADDPKMFNLFAACQATDMPIIIHVAPTRTSGYGMYDDLGLPRLEKALKTFPNLKIIGHSQAFWSEISGDVTEELRGKYPTGPVVPGGRVVELMRRYPNLYCDLSAGSGHNALMRDEAFATAFIEEFSDRILFGCDICHAYNEHPFGFRVFLERMLDEGKISEQSYCRIVRENAIRILKLDQ